jgi:hypothetical protein
MPFETRAWSIAPAVMTNEVRSTDGLIPCLTQNNSRFRLKPKCMLLAGQQPANVTDRFKGEEKCGWNQGVVLCQR